MKTTPDKCHLLSDNRCKKRIKIGDFATESSTQVKLSGIAIDNDRKFVAHVENLCKNASRKMHALV